MAVRMGPPSRGRRNWGWFMTESTFEDLLERTAAAFRLGRDGEGNETLTGVIDSLAGLLPRLDPLSMSRVQVILEPMLMAQNRGDYLLLADLLEYELAPLLGRAL